MAMNNQIMDISFAEHGTTFSAEVGQTGKYRVLFQQLSNIRKKL